MPSRAAQAALARPGMVLMTTMFWALSMLVMLSRKMVRSRSAKFSLRPVAGDRIFIHSLAHGLLDEVQLLDVPGDGGLGAVDPVRLQPGQQLLLGLDILLWR